MGKNLTLPQKNMYESQQFFDGTSLCNIGGLIIFKELNINVTTLEKAINKVICNCDTIRAKVIIKNSIPSQEISDYSYEKIDILNLTEKEYKFVMETWTSEPFDISRKMYDFKIVKIDTKTSVYIKLHHIVCDAWGIAIVARKIIDYYYKLTYKLSIPDDDIPKYDNYILKEEKYLNSTRYEDDEKFWQEKYKDKPSFVTMSPGVKSNHDVKAIRKSYNIPIRGTEAINKYCNDNNISLAVLLEAVTALYAARINNADDITLCSIVINRSGVEEKNTVGMFNNILPLTIKIDYEESFENLCQKVSSEHYQVYRHEKYPLSNIFNYIREKHGKSTELYDIMVSYQNIKLPQEITERVDTDWIFNGTSDLGFMLNISDRNNDGTISFDFDCRINCFDEVEIDKIYNRFINIVNQVVVNPDIKCKDIDILTFEEKEQILVDFNSTIKPYPNDKCLHYFLEENVKKNPNKVALRFEGKEITYKEFNEKANSLAHFIMKNEKRRNAIIGVMTERSFEMLIAIYAIIKSGNAYMPIDVNFPIDRIKYMLQDSKAQIVLSHKKYTSVINDSLMVVDLDSFDYDNYDNTNPQTSVVPNDVAYVIYTSGSTGKPKGAQVYHHSVINRIKWMHEKYPLNDGDIILQKTPYTFDVSVWELFWWSMYNQSLQILIPEGHKDPAEIINCIYKGNVTHMHFVPSMLNAFLEYIEANQSEIQKLRTLKYIFASGEALQVEHVKRFYRLLGNNNTTLHNLYGPTECTVDVSYYDCDKNNIPKSIPIGKPIDNTQLLILDKNRKLLPVGIVGELYISGVLVGKGYINNEELTDEKFVPNLYYNYGRMYKTGDLAKWLPDGNIEYVGRTDFQVKIRGLRIELGDIENSILKFDGIKQCVVNSFEINGDKDICAYYTSSRDIDVTALKKSLNNDLPNYMIPNYYMRLNKIPLNANGKTDRKLLPIPSIIHEDNSYVAPNNKVEEDVQKCVQEVLKKNKVSVEKDLFDMGLTSLGVISIITKLSSYGYELKVRDFYDSHTILELADTLQRKSSLSTDYEDDVKCYEDVSDINNHLLPTKEGNAILLTGATGFLGIHIIQDLINNTDKDIYCLIRNKEKFNRYISTFTNINVNNPRLKVANGDITMENLGLENNLANEIKINICDVIHCAASVSFFCPWESAKRINYEGTCNVLKFSEDAHAKLHYISTMSVSGDILTKQTKENPDFSEKNLYIGQLYKENVYSYSKYLAEKEIIKAIRENKVNASIYRIANLTWRTTDYVFQENCNVNDLYIITKVLIKYNKVPLELVNVDLVMTPVDECASAIVKLLGVKENRIYHLYSDKSLNMIKYIKSMTIPDIVSLKELAKTLSQESDISDEANFVLMYISGIINSPSTSIVSIKNYETNKLLEKLGFKWSELDDKYASSIKKLL